MTSAIRICPGCDQVQRWCNDPACSTITGGVLPQGHWTHLDTEATEACFASNGLAFIGSPGETED